LQIQPGTNATTKVISWIGAGFRLQYTENLDVNGNSIWIDVPGASPVTVPVVPGKNRFYRVVCP